MAGDNKTNDRILETIPPFKGTNIMYHFLVVIEKGENNYRAYAPDLPGCVATGESLEDVEKNMREAMGLHVKGMMANQRPIPRPRAVARYMDVTIPRLRA
jgi:predicted RNase H-like HicB family nuclease